MTDILKLLKLKHWLILFGASLVVVYAAFGLGHWIGSITGEADGRVACANEKHETLAKEVNKNAKNKKEVFTTPDLPLCLKYCERVLDDKPRCVYRCKRGDIPFRR
ncbi:MAG: hypothetical protein DI551_00795 [Micavibrio aeruginosavorus]|uniref:Uncharacterized protein n=1 Tax=Micavibrio aeruginosavorus TaxID=349221 RepID=A0A2W5N5X5_9BACT|nr:MAG: hypothetical protein DI551_00795 [Micavibrio aeruginosavorus]